MKFKYDKDTDSLYINFLDIPGVDSFEISEDVIADVDAEGRIVGLEVLKVEGKVDVSTMIFDNFPVKDIRFIGQHS